MANFDTIKTAIDANVNTNGTQAITGAVMNSVLKQMVDSTDAELTKLESETSKLRSDVNAIKGGEVDINLSWSDGRYDTNGAEISTEWFKKTPLIDIRDFVSVTLKASFNTASNANICLYKDGVIITHIEERAIEDSITYYSADYDAIAISLSNATVESGVELIGMSKGTYHALGAKVDAVAEIAESNKNNISLNATGIERNTKDIASINDTIAEILPAVKTTQTLMDLQFVNGYYKDTGEIVDVSWAKRTEAVSLDGIDALVFEGTFTNFPGGFIIFYKNGENVYRQSESVIYAATKPFVINCDDYDEVKFSFNAADIDLKKVYAQRKSEVDAIKEKTESLEERDSEFQDKLNSIDTELKENDERLASLEASISKELKYSFAPKVIGNFPFPIGEVFNIYRENVVTNEQDQEIVDYLANDMDEKKFMLYQNSEGNKEYSHIIYSKDFTDYLVNNFTIAFKEKNVTAKKVLLLGDSTIDTIVGGSIVQDGRIVHYLNNAYGGNLTLIGTRGEVPYKHCGIGGWSAADWVSKSDGNPFYNPTTSAFDFAYGITNNSLAIPDYVIIQLGINDVTATTSPTQFNTRMEAYIDAMQQIVNSIKAYSSSIKVCVNMIIPPSKDWNHYTAYAGAILTPNIAKWHDIIASHNALTRLTNVDYFLPINCVIDRDTMLADRVHPNAIGYETIAVFLANCLSVM